MNLTQWKYQNQQFCAAYNPPKNSPYRASKNDLEAFLKQLISAVAKQDSTIVTLVINLETADWESKTSEEKYEENVVEMHIQQTLYHMARNHP